MRRPVLWVIGATVVASGTLVLFGFGPFGRGGGIPAVDPVVEGKDSIPPVPVGAAVPPVAPVASAVSEAKQPNIVVEQAELDLGRVSVGKSVVHEFIFANQGKGVLEIASVATSCGCTVVGDWTRRVEPGGTGGVIMTFTVPEGDGGFYKTVNLVSNDPARPQTVFAVRGEAWRLFKAEPSSVAFSRTEGGAPGNEVKVRLVNQSEGPVELLEAQSPLPGTAVTLAEKVKGREYELTVAPREGAFSTGSAQIVIATSLPEVPQISIPLAVAALPALTVSPPQVWVTSNPLAEAAGFEVMIRSNTSVPLELPEVVAVPDGGLASIKEVEKGALYRLSISLPEGWRAPEERAALVVFKTQHPNYPRVEIPLLHRDTGPPPPRPPLNPTADAANAQPKPDLRFAKPIHDLGTVPAGAAIGHDFAFTVPEDGGPVEIVRVDACSNKGQVRDWTRLVAPGGKGHVSLALDTSGLQGPVEVAFLVMAPGTAVPAAELRLKAVIHQ